MLLKLTSTAILGPLFFSSSSIADAQSAAFINRNYKSVCRGRKCHDLQYALSVTVFAGLAGLPSTNNTDNILTIELLWSTIASCWRRGQTKE